MAKIEEKTPGLLLQAIPYLGQKKILKIFTPESGLLSLVVHRTKNSALTSPFCLAEWVVQKGRGDLYTFLDGSLINGLLDLRSNYAALTTAGQISSDLLKTQLPGKRSLEIFALVSAIFSKLAVFPHPETLGALFRIKYLIHEGLLSLGSCAICQRHSGFLSNGESFCSAHVRGAGWSFSSEEWDRLLFLSETRSFSAIAAQPIPPPLLQKLEQMFLERVR